MSMPNVDMQRVKSILGDDHALSPSTDFDLNPELAGGGTEPRAAAVLVGLINHHEQPHILLTRRAARLRHHPGQVAFPGGRVEPSDHSHEAAALREAHEEVGLHPSKVSVLGRLDPHITVTGFRAVPVVVEFAPFEPVLDHGEVAEMFMVPLSHLLSLEAYRLEGRRWQGSRRAYWAVPYGPWYIWGATARMLRGLALRYHGMKSWS